MIENSYLVRQPVSYSKTQLEAYLSSGERVSKKDKLEIKQRFLENHKKEREEEKIGLIFGNDLALVFIHSKNMRFGFEYHSYSHKCILVAQSIKNKPTQTDMFSENGLIILSSDAMVHLRQQNNLDAIIPSRQEDQSILDTRIGISLYPNIKSNCSALQLFKETFTRNFAVEIADTLELYNSQLRNLDKYPANKSRRSADVSLWAKITKKPK